MLRLRAMALTAAFVLFAFSTVLYVGCKDKCGSTTCNNGGTCIDNVCSCPTGYSGNSCSTTWVTPYLGTFTGTSNECVGGPGSAPGWQSIITTSANNPGYTVTISNFAGSNQSIDATVDTLGNLAVAPAVGTYGVSADGVLNVADSTIITMHYTVSSATGIDVACTFVLKKLE